MIGSICTGIGGLDLAVGGDLAWVAETNKDAAAVLDVRFPDVTNIGDWTQLDCFEVDVLIGGLPCQPVSAAGRGKGKDDERYLYDELVRILRSSDMRPALVLENVRGFLYPRHGRELWRLVSALADMGYMGRYGVVRASDAGAPHRRERWFCVATHPDGAGSQGQEPAQRQYVPTGGSALATHPDGEGQRQRSEQDSEQIAGERGPCGDDVERCGMGVEWGDYELAVRRWEYVLRRPAPAPLDGRRLSPRFVEWMMGFPDGWVTDPSLGLSRTAQLRCLGNAVVPQQARLALEVV